MFLEDLTLILILIRKMNNVSNIPNIKCKHELNTSSYSYTKPKIGGQKYTFCTLLTTTVLTFGQNDSFPLYFKSKRHIII